MTMIHRGHGRAEPPERVHDARRTGPRRRFLLRDAPFATLLVLAARQRAWALSLSDLTDKDAAAGVRAALEKGAQTAVALLGQPGGFLDNPKVRIPLPGHLEDARGALKLLGLGPQLDELVTGMNRAAEAAVPLGKQLLVNAVKSLSVQDAKQILAGGDNAVTEFFAGKTRVPLGEAFLPVVGKTVNKLGLAQRYDRIAEQASRLNLIGAEQSRVDRYVTGKTLDGLYTVIGEQERKIRQDPVGAGSAVLQKVFGALR